MSAIAKGSAEFPLPAGETFSYGTAGFRTVGEKLSGVAFRMGVLMTLRSRKLGGSTGIMISASHNPHADNGMKLVDKSGTMLEESWEKVAEKFANSSGDDLTKAVETLISDESIPEGDGVVFIGRDTRKTGPDMLKATMAGVLAAGGKAVDFGVVTTPQLHFFVWKQGNPTAEDYYTLAISSFKSLFKKQDTDIEVVVDCSNGVGAVSAARFAADAGDCGIKLSLVNTDTDNVEKLNHLCGGDYVQKEKVTPPGVEPSVTESKHFAAFDGDADRLIYFYFREEEGAKKFVLLDGDRIAVLLTAFIKKLVDEVPGISPKIGIVQTAYANGASTTFMNKTGVEVTMTPTGVKHLHHKALDYDIGIYFEANGHGTVIFSQDFTSTLYQSNSISAQKLIAVSKLASPVCGDALLDLLLCEAALQGLGWSVTEWARMYTDAPSKMTKVTVPDPQKLKTSWDQTKAVEPAGIQPEIDAAVAKFPAGSRSFVRPSGTEPIVRVYAESDTLENSSILATQVEDIVKKHLN
eukprot:TRINITY_DN6588_c3_g1_i1.p1 TRINITY_DN6588_c3_g1~~TRINITY_DN6588_c3_g1_i1.p1  ORF type:complete len:522 (+),score=105.58 TRINITY_DN6588_c3_g1_i1:65-1630(+)